MTTITIAIPTTGTLPRKKDIVDAFNVGGQMPGTLEGQLAGYKTQAAKATESLTATAKQELDAQFKEYKDSIDEVRNQLDTIPELLSPYWTKYETRNYQKEAKDAIGDLINEFHVYIPVKMLELVGDLIPVSFTINVMGVSVDLLTILTAEEQLRIKQQIKDNIDTFWALVPDSFKFWEGEYGIQSLTERVKLAWDYFKSLVIEGATGLLHGAFGTLISTFDKIWDPLGLPSLPALLAFDVESFVLGHLQSLAGQAYSTIVSTLESVQLFGLSLLDVIGGSISETTNMAEDKIRELAKAAREWFTQWQKELINQWIDTVASFFDAIGLSALVDMLTLTFTEVLELIGVPLSYNITIPTFEVITIPPASAA